MATFGAVHWLPTHCLWRSLQQGLQGGMGSDVCTGEGVHVAISEVRMRNC